MPIPATKPASNNVVTFRHAWCKHDVTRGVRCKYNSTTATAMAPSDMAPNVVCNKDWEDNMVMYLETLERNDGDDDDVSSSVEELECSIKA
mmetsp:Transcript_42890/g.65888  ORF Transcript_42890/g.65888 Transcript_42890/m.65888 type:complete len:91 (-) Transcript_42890:335-607(-)